MGIPNIPLCPPGARPLHVPPSPPGQTAGHSSLQPPPAPAADTARASQRPDFSPWRGTPQLPVPGINPGQLKQQEDKGAVPALRPRRPGCPATTLAGSWRSCSVTAPGPLRQESQASGLGRGGFFVPLRRRNDLSPSLPLSLLFDVELPRFSQPEILFPFPHRVTCRERAESSSRHIPPPQQFLKPSGKYWAGTEANWKPAVPGPKIPARTLAGSPNHGFKPPSATPAMGTGANQCWELQRQGFAGALCRCKGWIRKDVKVLSEFLCFWMFPSDHQDPLTWLLLSPQTAPVTQPRPGHILQTKHPQAKTHPEVLQDLPQAGASPLAS